MPTMLNTIIMQDSTCTTIHGYAQPKTQPSTYMPRKRRAEELFFQETWHSRPPFFPGYFFPRSLVGTTVRVACHPRNGIHHYITLSPRPSHFCHSEQAPGSAIACGQTPRARTDTTGTTARRSSSNKSSPAHSSSTERPEQETARTLINTDDMPSDR